MLSTPPSRLVLADVVSVKEIWMPSEDVAEVGEWGVSATVGVEVEGKAASSAEVISLLSASYSPTFFFLPSCIPFPFIGAAGLIIR